VYFWAINHSATGDHVSNVACFWASMPCDAQVSPYSSPRDAGIDEHAAAVDERAKLPR